MSRQNHLFQSTVNRLLNMIKHRLTVGESMPNDSDIARQLKVSRSTARKAVTHLISLNILDARGTHKTIINAPDKTQYFLLEENTGPKEKLVELHFMTLLKHGKIKPGDRFSELELARQSNCNTVAVREFLIRFSRFGLIEKKPRSQWSMKLFHESIVDDHYELRHLFEMNTLANLMILPTNSTLWNDLEVILKEHQKLKSELSERHMDFFDLDRRFHKLLQAARPNQFISEFYDVISFIFHYHYQWVQQDNYSRYMEALDEHIDIISKILMHDLMGATLSMEKHLINARNSLKNQAARD